MTQASWTKDPPLVWAAERVPGSCRLTEFDGYDDDNLLLHGTSLVDTWPGNVRYGMDPEMPNDLVLLDAVRARSPLIVASARLADFLASTLSPGNIELLPVTIVNHKKRAVAERHFIVNPLGQQDCLDIKACKVRWSTIAPDSISELKHLVIDRARIDPGVSLFRPKHLRRLILARQSLAKAIDEAGFTGLRWIAPQDFEGL